jgi:uncharacterized protein
MNAPLPDFIHHQTQNLSKLCRTHRVRRMDLFSSAADGRFDAGRSDLDFAVLFEAMPPAEHAAHFFALLNALRDLFKYPVDLVEIPAIRNPYLLSHIQAQRVTVYGA